MAYKVVSITDIDGNPRTDGRYPLRIGRVCKFMNALTIGQCLYIRWLMNADGSRYDGYIRTSIVCNLSVSGAGRITVTTHNSVYTFDPYPETNGN